MRFWVFHRKGAIQIINVIVIVIVIDGNGDDDDDDDDDDGNVVVSFFSISGTAGDSLRYHENKNFSTNFQDNNQQELTNCPQHFLGAWWHDGCNPLQSNLNGGYFKKNSVLWLSLKGYRNSLKSTSMKIRSVTGERMHYSRAENNKSVDSGTNSQGFSSAWRWVFVARYLRAGKSLPCCGQGACVPHWPRELYRWELSSWQGHPCQTGRR